VVAPLIPQALQAALVPQRQPEAAVRVLVRQVRMVLRVRDLRQRLPLVALVEHQMEVQSQVALREPVVAPVALV